MINPFRKRKSKKVVDTIPSSPPPTDYSSFPSNSKLPPRPGIFIASTPAAPRSSYHARQQQQAGPSSPSSWTQQQQQQSLDHVLPPASDYRQSLIMPHLTRRFTLLRAPDGSLVSPDAMRAHLRAQRARARAANLAIGSGASNNIHFLTEDEENEIIDQLKAQARAEGRDFDLERSTNAAAADSWRSGYAAGTDGFGSWGPISSNHTNTLSSLADTLADLSYSHDQASSPIRKPGGSSFSGRSAERDHAAFRTAKRERNNSRPDDSPPAVKSDSHATMASSQDTALVSPTVDERQNSHDTARPALQDDDLPDSPMPGGFAASTNGQTNQASSDTQPDSASTSSKPLLHVPGLDNVSRSRTSQDSNLLTTLSPEAFKRVSTALDEVFGLIASERASSPNVAATSTADLINSNDRPPRSSVESDTNSFTSAVSNVRALDAKQPDSDLAGPSRSEQTNPDEEDEHDDTADRTITATQPSLDAAHIEHGRLALASPLPGPLPGALPPSRSGFVSDMPESQTLTALPSMVTSNSVQTVTDADLDTVASQAGSASLMEPGSSQHLSVSGHSMADSMLTRPSDRSSTATATEAQPQSMRIVSTASTIEAPELPRQDQTAAPSAARIPEDNQRSLDGPMQAPAPPRSSSRTQPAHPYRTPEMDSNAFAASPARSTLSRGDSIVSASSVRSSSTGPAASYQGSHGRKSSADKLALARSMAPHPHLREQPSLSSVRRNYRQHTRSATGSSEGSLLGGYASRRSSGAMSPPPVLSRSARSPSYFPPPSSTASMHDYASGFKPPSAVSPAAAAALQSMASQANYAQQPMQSNVMDASNALRSAQNLRNSASTGRSAASPYVPNTAAFASGSDRAAATSSPETGGTSISVHKRSTSLTKQLPQAPSTRVSAAVEDGLSSSMYAPRPAPMPSVASQPSQAAPSQAAPPQSMINGNGLMPNPPSDPEQASRWRAVYGTKAADAVSLRASAEDVSADPNDDEDLWAKMASEPESNNAERPVSNFPPSIAEERLAGTGITFDQIADFQDRLIQTANGGEVVPPLPRIQADTHAQNLHQQQKFAEAKSKGLASPNLVLGSDLWESKPAEDVQSASQRAFAGPNGKSIDTSRDAPMRRSFSSSVSRDPPVSPRAVMYDVTTSHRPTSPPLHSRNGSLSGLPSLLELNGSVGHRNRDSFSLSQAVEKASRLPRHPMFQSTSIAEDPDSTNDTDSQYAVAPAAQVQEHPYNAGYTSPSMPTSDLRSGTSFTFPRSPKAADVGDSSRRKAQPFPPEDVWDRYGPQQGGVTPDFFDTSLSPDSSFLGSDPARLLDDVAAQTSAATRALKGTDDGTVPTPPFRTKSISRKKSFKKVSKQISSPQLISTTQKLDHATQIAASFDTPSVPSTATSKRSNRSPGWGSIGFDGSRSHVKASPSGTSPMGSFGKSSAYFHRRRSSSFGHDARPNVNLGTPNGDVDGVPASVEHSGSSDRAAADVHPNHPYMNGGANGGSLSRLFSKIKSRKNEQAFGGATIEPFPPELSAAARASESFSKQQQQPQAPVTPEMPSLPPVERSTPWTLPRMPSSASSTDRGSSLRSPTSPIYTLPIDSTSMQRSKSKKKRTPIVLKRESQIIMPGDPGYIPTAIIGRSPEQRAGELQAQQAESQARLQAAQSEGNSMVVNSAGGSAQQAEQERSTDTTLEAADPERMDYCQSRNSGTLAPPAGGAAEEADDESTTPRPTSPKSTAVVAPGAGATGAAKDDHPVEADDTVNADADTTLPAATQTLPKAADSSVTPAGQPEQDAADRRIDARKSLRDTIVRRTIIIPAGIDFSDQQRRSYFGSSRKSRRFAAAEDEPVPNSGDAAKSFQLDSPAVVDGATLPKPEGGEGYALDAAGQQEENVVPISSSQTLHPDSSAAAGHVTTRSNRASRVESSYAGSLYDMYIGGNGGENIEFGSPGSDDLHQDLTGSGTRRSAVPPATRASRMMPPRHIEVTERADGSVVWQVIAGLADRASVYSDFDPTRHSRHLSDASASAAVAGADVANDDGMGEDMVGAGLPFRTPAGLTDDDSRSFFTRPNAAGGATTQQYHPAFSLDTNEPLPTRLANGANGARQDVFDMANPSLVDRSNPTPNSTAAASSADVATPAHPATAASTATRIVYHTDAQLASLLDVLAKGKDSAKFEFHIGGPAQARHSILPAHTGAEEDPVAAWAEQEGSGPLLDANDIESHRSRVEAEIYTLLNRRAVVGGE